MEQSVGCVEWLIFAMLCNLWDRMEWANMVKLPCRAFQKKRETWHATLGNPGSITAYDTMG